MREAEARPAGAAPRFPPVERSSPERESHPRDLDEVLIDLRIGRLARRTVPAWMDGERPLLPVSPLLEMGEVDFGVDADGVLRAVLYPGRRLVIVDPRSSRASRAGVEVPVGEGAMTYRQGELFVEASLLEELFGMTIRTDWSTLTSVVMDPESLPLGQRVARESRWRFFGPAGSANTAFLTEPDQGHIGGAVLDWSIASNMGDFERTASYAVGLGGRVLGGGLQLSARSLGSISEGEQQFDATYQKVWRESPWLTQMRLGDGFATSPRYRSLRGISLTNAPVLRSSLFGTDSFSGRVGPGWDVELRQSGQTLDLTRADEQGAFALDIPLRYGDNPIQVVAFGPHGEVVTTERLVVLGADRVPAGTLEWGASAGACRGDACESTGNLDLRYGLSNRWTLRGGVEAFGRDELPALVQPYLAVSGAVTDALHLSLEGLDKGYARAGSIFAPNPGLRLRGAHTLFARGVEQPVLHDGRRRSTTEADLFLRPFGASSRLFFQASLLRQSLDVGALSRWQASTSLRLHRTGVEVGFRREVEDLGDRVAPARDYPFASVTTMLPVWDRKSLWVRGEVETLSVNALQQMRAMVAYQATPTTRVEVGGGWRRGRGGDLTLSLSAELAPFRSLTQVFAPEGDDTRVSQVMRGTVHWNEALGNVDVRPGPGLERGGVSGYVYVDENGNGVRDEHEQNVPGVRLVIDGKAVTSDAEGRHQAWDLVPFEPVRIWADSASIGDPRMVPVHGEIRVTVPPASSARVDVALTLGREISGRVVVAGERGDVPLANAELELVDLATGTVRSVHAFSDGEFYEAGVKPGRYELRVAPGSLGAMQLRPERESQAVEVPASSDGGPLDPIVVRLVSNEAPGAGS